MADDMASGRTGRPLGDRNGGHARHGRAIGETMAVMMVTDKRGPDAAKPRIAFHAVRTMTATIAAEMGEVANGSVHYHALFGIGIILFILTFVINLVAAKAIFKKQYRGGLR